MVRLSRTATEVSMEPPTDIIIFATADWHTPYLTNKQHTARHLARMGFRVLYVESPGLRAPSVNRKDLARIVRRLARGIRPPRQVEPRIWVFSPLTIPFKHHRPFIRSLNRRLLRFGVDTFIRQQRFHKPLLWTYHPFMLDAVEDLDSHCLVYHCVDDLSEVPRVDSSAFRTEEERLLRRADHVFTTTKVLQEKCASVSSNSVHLPNVVDFDHFRRGLELGALPEDLAAIPEPRIGFIGLLSDFKVDFPLVEEIAGNRPEWNWVVLGDEPEGQCSLVIARLRKVPNVHFLGYKPYEMLPDYLRGFSVAVLPCLLNEYTRSMFPMKFFEYLAGGAPVVTTALEFTRTPYLGSLVAETPAAFLEAIGRQLARGRLSPTEAAAAVGDNTWEARLGKMLDRIGVDPPRKEPRHTTDL